MMKSAKFSASSNQGFTLIEVLVVVIMVGVLAAIAAPSWLAFLNNQRVGSVRTQVTEILSSGQSEAKRTKTSRAVVVDNNGNSPRMAIVPVIPVSASSTQRQLAPVTNWTVLGEGNIQAGLLQLTTQQKAGAAGTTATVVFDADGTVDVSGNVTGTPTVITQLPFSVTVKPVASAQPARCVLVQTLLGSILEADGSNNSCVPN
jgi:prepilin-type N-terminal cleavage/methylation domain-containing protein